MNECMKEKWNEDMKEGRNERKERRNEKKWTNAWMHEMK